MIVFFKVFLYKSATLALAILSKTQKVNKAVSDKITKLLARLQVWCFQLQDRFKFTNEDKKAQGSHDSNEDFSRFNHILNLSDNSNPIEVVERAIEECKPAHRAPERTVDARNLVEFIEKNKDYPSGDKVIATIRRKMRYF